MRWELRGHLHDTTTILTHPRLPLRTYVCKNENFCTLNSLIRTLTQFDRAKREGELLEERKRSKRSSHQILRFNDATTMDLKAAGDYIRKAASSNPSDPALQTAIDLYDRKLWHQLTELCLKLSTTILSTDSQLYTDFLIHFQKKLNPISLITILTNLVNHAYKPQENPEEALSFLRTSTEPSIDDLLKSNANALILYHALCARLFLFASKNEEAKEELEKARDLVDATFDLDANTHASFYRASAEFHKVMGPANDFYKYALLFLAYVRPGLLSVDERKSWAFDIGIAALVGEDIYTFEEVLRHGLVKELGMGEGKWLVELMSVMNRGDVEGYEAVVEKYKKVMNREEALVINAEFLKKKNKILGLVAMAEVADGVIRFEDVEKKCQVSAEDVEYLIMRALSLGLIKGEVDGVEGVLEVSRVRPKLLDREACSTMAQRLAIWQQNVADISGYMEKESLPLVSS
eukprot:Plantae.Rhodophyta-Hildenbrandia_rubra.ctg3333.p1 GENE.Plantae.Rhodophyta-Hildenbrandia_rubra.ctg3333~~Plantae.Rhodophyta-Hildenbrandia_rubra.ctg3333.p1  ORF type:complete len:463 (+),score=93.20 Plantae.Rhodophyta-Hildenbrandia_rubra.ctg3333:1315-2703(+)